MIYFKKYFVSFDSGCLTAPCYWPFMFYYSYNRRGFTRMRSPTSDIKPRFIWQYTDRFVVLL